MSPNAQKGNYSYANVLVVPDLQEVITPTGDESSLMTSSRVGTDQASRRRCRCPANRVHAHAMRMEDLMRPAVVTELQNANMAVGRCTGKQTATLVWGP